MAEGDRRRARGSKSPRRASKHEHSHPGGTGAVLGTQLARYSSAQGLSLLITNVLHYASIPVVAWFLGASSLGSYALLFFVTSIVTQVIHLASKPGTIMRTFGVTDEDDVDDDDDGEEEGVSTRPTYTLGVGIVWCTFLAAVAIGLAFAFRTQIADFLLHDPNQGNAVLFATITGAVWAIFKLGEIVYWFEKRPLAYALIDASRPTFNLIAIIAILASGAGVEGAILGQAVGTTLAAVICIALLRGSFQLGFDFGELWEILKRGSIRVPIASSMWVIQQADVFILSRYVSHSELGIYTFASRTGFMVAFLPQGFRMALRPIRKGAAFRAFRREYGVPVAQGQLLAYFVLVTLTAVLAMVLGGEILIQIGGPRFESAAPIVPLTAAAMSMPALYRTVNTMATYPNKRRVFITATVGAALLYVGLMVLLLSQTGIGIYAAPISMLLAFTFPITFMFLRSQLGDDPVEFPYLAMFQATVVAAGLAVAYHFAHPDNKWVQLPLIALVMGIWIASLFVLRIIPTYHWHPLRHIAVSAIRGSPLRFDVPKGLASLEPGDRGALWTAVNERLPAEALVPSLGEQSDSGPAQEILAADANSASESEGARLVRLLRQAGSQGGVPVADSSELDAGIALFLFSDRPVSVRLAKMRELLSSGGSAHDLRTLEDLRDDLARAPTEAWAPMSRETEERRSGAPLAAKRA
ncbi:MAG TPA: lipopolysaccharide biosynthesis protein [Solirubrobacterales bacterium]|nr:lipopolysaccharide biosynthesis protein [Solirubrobacterales bacterium]